MTVQGLNPFGTGQCLSTYNSQRYRHQHQRVSIPLEQGNVFRSLFVYLPLGVVQSQSLWNRAMSFDLKSKPSRKINHVSQSLWNRAMSFD